MKKLLLLLALIFIPNFASAQSNPVVGNGTNINGTSPTLSGLSVNSNTTSGAIKLGGTTASCVFDYGVTSATTLTFPCATTITGLVNLTGGLTVTTNINGSGFAYQTGTSSYGATSATVNGPLVATSLTANNLISTNGVGIADDGATAHGMNFYTANNATNGYTFYNGPAPSPTPLLQVTNGGSVLLSSMSPTTCLDFNVGFNNSCPLIGNSGDGGLNIGLLSASNYGLRIFSDAGTTGVVSAQFVNLGLILNPTNSTNCIQLQTVTPTCPAITNSTENGMNFIDSSSSSLGFRFISDASNGTLTQMFGVNNSGNAQLAGSLQIGTNGADPQGATSPALNVTGDVNTQRGNTHTGTYYFGGISSQYIYFDGTEYVINGGPVRATANQGFQLGGGVAITEQTTTAAGTSCQYFDFQIQNSTSLVCIDGSGNLGAAGNFYSASERKLKNNIKDYTGPEALDIALHTQVVRYCYKTEKCIKGEERHIGFIADDTSAEIAPNHKSMDVNATAAVALAAIKYQQQEISQLQKALKIKPPAASTDKQTNSSGLFILAESIAATIVIFLLGFLVCLLMQRKPS